MIDVVFLYVTAPDVESAASIAETLVAERLAACANILPGMTAVFRWEGAIERAAEVAMIVKTTAASAPAASARIVALHPYETPCVVALPAGAAGSNPAFVDWIVRETAPAHAKNN